MMLPHVLRFNASEDPHVAAQYAEVRAAHGLPGAARTVVRTTRPFLSLAHPAATAQLVAECFPQQVAEKGATAELLEHSFSALAHDLGVETSLAQVRSTEQPVFYFFRNWRWLVPHRARHTVAFTRESTSHGGENARHA